MQVVRFLLTSIVLGCVLLFPSSLGQDKKSKDKTAKQQLPPSTLRVAFNFETVEGLPADAKLQVENLKIIEDGSAQKIDSLDSKPQGVSYGLLIDTSGSMLEYFSGIKLLTISLIDQLGSSDEMFIVQVKKEAELLQGITADKDALYKSVEDLYTGGGSALYDSVIAGADYLQENAKKPRRTLIVLTDVVERGSEWKLDETLEAIAENNVQISVIRLFNQQILARSERPIFGGNPLEKSVAKGTSVFDSLASLTGGAFVKYSAPLKVTKEETPALLRVTHDYTMPIFQLAKANYRLSYLTTNQKFDGQPRNAQVIWQDQEGKAFTKEFKFVVPKK